MGGVVRLLAECVALQLQRQLVGVGRREGEITWDAVVVLMRARDVQRRNALECMRKWRDMKAAEEREEEEQEEAQVGQQGQQAQDAEDSSEQDSKEEDGEDSGQDSSDDSD